MAASDVFVLPTLNEGCCNAIIEALSCGIPVISSDRDFNHDILDETCSIMIDPSNIDQIRSGIILLANNAQLRKKLSDGAVEKAFDFSIVNRAKKILAFMESKL